MIKSYVPATNHGRRLFSWVSNGRKLASFRNGARVLLAAKKTNVLVLLILDQRALQRSQQNSGRYHHVAAWNASILASRSCSPPSPSSCVYWSELLWCKANLLVEGLRVDWREREFEFPIHWRPVVCLTSEWQPECRIVFHFFHLDSKSFEHRQQHALSHFPLFEWSAHQASRPHANAQLSSTTHFHASKSATTFALSKPTSLTSRSGEICLLRSCQIRENSCRFAKNVFPVEQWQQD